MTTDLHLDPNEVIAKRPFTNLENSREDLTRLRAMTQQLIDTYEDPVVCDFSLSKGAVCQSDPQGRHFRIYYIQPDKLFSMKNLSVVGFFGHRRPEAEVEPLLKADKQFEKLFHDFEGLLSLSTVRLPGGDFGNLVLFTDDEAKDQWNFNPTHYDTVTKISPPYYSSIRLNNGVLPNGLESPNQLHLTKVRYLDYDEMPPWRAVRVFEGLEG